MQVNQWIDDELVQVGLSDIALIAKSIVHSILPAAFFEFAVEAINSDVLMLIISWMHETWKIIQEDSQSSMDLETKEYGIQRLLQAIDDRVCTPDDAVQVVLTSC